VPLQYEEICLGVIELASFTEIAQYQRQFIETLSAQLTATIHTTQISQKTTILLEESRMQTEELKVREEELKQNLEEMQAIQEDFQRKTNDYEQLIAELQNQGQRV
jgi:DNA repair exonuclease SbcCD ATPase subunit